MSSLTGINAPIMAFDASFSELAVISSDGRVKLFSTNQQKTVVDITQTLNSATTSGGHTQLYSCLAWGTLNSKASKNKSKTDSRYLYLGSLSGTIVCYDASRATVVWTCNDAVDGSIASLSVPNAITASPSDASRNLLVLGSLGNAAILDKTRGNVLTRWQASKNPTSRGALLSANGTALIAGSSISLHDISSGACIHKWTGHALPVVALHIAPSSSTVDNGSTYFCSAAEGERAAVLWSLETNESNGKLRHASSIAQLNMQQPIKSIAISCAKNTNSNSISHTKNTKNVKSHDSSTESDVFHVALLTKNGDIGIFECRRHHHQDKGSAHDNMTVRKWAHSISAPVLFLGIEHADATGLNLILAVGSSARPHFRKLRLDLDAAKDVVVIDIPGGIVPGLGEENHDGVGAVSGGKKNIPLAVIGPGGDLEEGLVSSRVVASKRRLDTGDDNSGDVDDDAMDVDNEDDNNNEDDEEEGFTFAERIAALQEKHLENSMHTAATTRELKKNQETGDVSKPLKADSLSVLLSQALQSNDTLLLERCLTVRNPDIIRKTVLRLSPTDASIFLKVLVQRLQSSSKPGRGDQLTVWIRSVVLHHAAYLAAIGGGSGTLSYLYQIIESRLSSYQPLLSLNGRLDLVLANSKRRNLSGIGGDDDDDDFEEDQKPLKTFEVDSDGVGVEIDDAFQGALGDDDDDDDLEEEDDDDDDDLEDEDDDDEFLSID